MNINSLRSSNKMNTGKFLIIRNFEYHLEGILILNNKVGGKMDDRNKSTGDDPKAKES